MEIQEGTTFSEKRFSLVLSKSAPEGEEPNSSDDVFEVLGWFRDEVGYRVNGDLYSADAVVVWDNEKRLEICRY